jgi:hypothetical protein
VPEVFLPVVITLLGMRLTVLKQVSLQRENEKKGTVRKVGLLIRIFLCLDYSDGKFAGLSKWPPSHVYT